MAIHRLEAAEITSDENPGSRELLEKLNEAKDEVERFEKAEAEGAMVTTRLKWNVEGEKPSKYFCGLEKYNALQKYIPSLKVKDETAIRFCFD